MKNYRHGDVALIGVKTLPKELKAVDTKVLVKDGSGGNSHTFTGGKFYPNVSGAFVVGYLVAEDGAKLYHPEHGEIVAGSTQREMNIETGVYEVRRQIEDTHEGMKQVVD